MKSLHKGCDEESVDREAVDEEVPGLRQGLVGANRIPPPIFTFLFEVFNVRLPDSLQRRFSQAHELDCKVDFLPQESNPLLLLSRRHLGKGHFSIWD